MQQNDLLDLFLEKALERVGEPARRRVPRAMLESSLRAELTMQLARCEGADFASTFAHHCPVDGASPQDYAQRVLTLKDGALLLCGVRFYGGDTSAPFIDLIASSQGFDDPDHLRSCLSAAAAACRVFSPSRARLLSFETQLDHDIDQSFYAASLATISTYTPKEIEEPCTLEPVSPKELEEAHRFVTTHYATTLELDPSLEGRLFPALREGIEEAIEQDHVWWISAPDLKAPTRCGLIALSKEDGPFLSGLCVMEEIIAPHARGRSLAASAQCVAARRLIERGVASHTLLWGTIDVLNVASTKTASKAGREEVARWIWAS